MHSLVQPNAWVALKLPTGNLRVLQVTPNTTVSLGKYGSFPSNLIIHRPFHLTYELQDKREPETFNRLRVVPPSELYGDILSPNAASSTPDESTPAPEEEEEEAENPVPTGIEYALVDPESGDVVAKTNRAELDASARQTLTMEEIEALKKDATDAGKDLIAKLMLSHRALDQKTQYSLAKYKLLKTKKYIRRFSVLPLDVPLLDHFLLEEKDPVKIMDLREEMIGLIGCWANVHFGGEDPCETESALEKGEEKASADTKKLPGRWLVVDDTGGLLVAAMAERMGILYPPEQGESLEAYMEAQQSPKRGRESMNQDKFVATETESTSSNKNGPTAATEEQVLMDQPALEGIVDPLEPEQAKEQSAPTTKSENPAQEQSALAADSQPGENEMSEGRPRKYPPGDGKRYGNDMNVPYAQSNTLTVIHANSQPNLAFLRYYDFDAANPAQPLSHPLARKLMTLSWLQLLDPSADSTYMSEPASATPEDLKSWKPNRRGNYYRKRRRWARIKHIVDSTRNGGFSGLVVASTMDPISILRHAAPLLAGGAPISIYSQSIEPLTALMDCYSIARRTAWVQNPPKEAVGKSTEELEHWAGTEEFPLNPTLLLGAGLQTSRVRKWQVLPGRTHPLMTSRGGAEGYIFTAWRVKPAEGKVEARGKSTKKRKTEP